MLRALFCTGALLALALMHAAAAPAATAPLPRLAVVCLDDNDRTKTLADLVQLELGKSGKVDMVERAEFERILAEQKLSAAGLTGVGAQIAVGKILRADALLLLERDRKVREFRVRLTDTLYGAQLCRLTLANQEAPTSEAASPIVCNAVLAALAKLAVPPAQRLLVTVMDVRNGTLSKDCAWVETEVPDLLETALIREPRVFVLDRQRLRELLKEVQSTAGNDAAFSTGAILIDGDLAVKPGVALGKGVTPVTLTVRLRGGDLTEIGRVQADGTLDKARDLFPPVQADLVKKIVALGPQKPVRADTEKRLLQEAGARAFNGGDVTRGVVFAEAAHGLDGKDPKAVGALLGALTDKNSGAIRWLFTGSPTKIQDAVDTVLRMYELLPLATPDDCHTACFHLMLTQNSILSLSALDLLSEAQRAQLRPLRALLRQEGEKSFRDQPMFLAGGSETFFEDVGARNDYVRSLIERALDLAATPLPKRARAVAGIFVSGPFRDRPSGMDAKMIPFLDKLTRHDDSVARYFAARILAENLSADKERQRDYATRALAALPDVMIRDELFENQINLNSFHPLHDMKSLTGWAASHGADATEALTNIVGLFDGMLTKGDFVRYARTRPDLVLPDLSPADAIGLIDRAAAVYDKLDRAAPFRRPLSAPPEMRGPLQASCAEYLRGSIRLRLNLVNRHFPEMALADSPGRKVLLCTQSPAWKELSATARRTWGASAEKWRDLSPRKLLIDGDTLWIAFNGPGILLVQIDLATRGVLRSWVGPVLPEPTMTPFYRYYNVMCRWGDTICLASHDGVWIVPPATGANGEAFCLDASHRGLLDPVAFALAPLGDDLFVGTKSGLWKYNRRAAATELVASSRAQDAVRRLVPDTEVASLVTNSQGTKLYILSKSLQAMDKRVYVQRFVPATGELTDLSPVLMPKRSPPAADTALRNTFSERTNVEVDPFKVYVRLSIFDPDAEKIVPERGAVPMLPEDLVDLWEHQVYSHGDVLAIRGSNFDMASWSVEQLSGLPMPVADPPPVTAAAK